MILTLLAFALAPALPITMVSTVQMAKLRLYWLLGLLAVGGVWLAWHGEVWLALMALWFLCRWRSAALLPHALTWAAIGATWGLLRALPPAAFDYLPWGWLACAVLQVGLMIHQQRTHDFAAWIDRKSLGYRGKGTLGSPVITAMSLALAAPFCPWWLWPVLAVGFYLTWSWIALASVAIAYAWLYPPWAGWILGAFGALFLAWLGSWTLERTVPWVRGQRLFEWTPRGDSVDSIVNRLVTWGLIVQAWWHGPRWLGRGPGTMDPQLYVWSTRAAIDLPNGEAHCELLQHLYEYGLVGCLAAAAFVYHVGGGLRLGDEFSAALLAGAFMTFFHWPTRQPAIGLVWLACAAGVLR